MDDELSDETLVVRVARGDAGALQILCGRWERPLLAFLDRQTGGRDVEDLYQDTWLRVVKAAPRSPGSRAAPRSAVASTSRRPMAARPAWVRSGSTIRDPRA